jgi:hypothetical protein
MKGFFELDLSSSSSDWEEVTKAVLNAYGMKVFYNTRLVAMKARMKIDDDGIADKSQKEKTCV